MRGQSVWSGTRARAWQPSSPKQALVYDESSPFFTTPHFNGHPSVLLRASQRRAHPGEARRAAAWLSEHP